jgi:membrane associated rhomboid family serine protease
LNDTLSERLKARIFWIAGLVLLLWAVEAANMALGGALSDYGIRPRTVSGLTGILCAPFLHGSPAHLALNTLPLIILGSLVILRGVQPFLGASAVIILLGGAGVWVMGRNAVHIGASGLIFGYLGYLLSRGWYGRDPLSIVIALAAAFLYGGMIWGVFPNQVYVSWEAHLCGFIAGFLAGRLEGVPDRS